MADVYERLQERLDMFPQGFPKTEGGVELDILKELVTPDEAEIMLFLRPSPEPAAAMAERMGRDETELGEILYQMSKRGLILRGTIEGQTFYFLAPWMVGIWEFQLNNLNEKNIALYERYFKEGMVPERRKSKTSGMRVIPIEQEIQDSSEAQSFEKVSEIIESAQRFAVADCICRKEAQLMGHGCDKLLEGCMTFNLAAEYCIENGLAREITKDEAREVLIKAEESGLVHNTSNHKGDKIFICNCCGCCCKALAHVVQYDNPWAIARANYYAVVDEESCSVCEACVERCQVGAVRVEDDAAVVNADVCIGCGLCVSTCPVESISMIHRPPEQASVVFDNQDELLQTMAREKNKVFPFE
jgi:Pyruvate/2-oxoacid:ferredoxin oxidoreductase delta subunit